MAMKSKYTDIDLSKYDAGFQGTDATRRAEQQKVDAENAVANLGDFKYINQALYDQAMNASLNREKFSYDLNGDALYQQYKDNYITQGKQAMMDTMGQAAAMTGGYGNSYAATVGNQTYQGHLQNLNNIVPELYQMALDRYNSEGDRLAQNFAMLSADRETARADYDAKLNRLLTDRSYYSDNYNNVYNQAYTGWNDNRTYDTNQFWNEHNAGYTAEQDAKAHELALAQFEEQKRAQAVAEQLQRDQLNEQIRANRASEAAADDNGGNGGTPLESPSEPMLEAARMAALYGGQGGLDNYIATLPNNIDTKAVYDYASRYYDKNAIGIEKTTDKGLFGWGKKNDIWTDMYGNTYTYDQMKLLELI